ncbi:hypothetical protein, partial [Listeria monocytogenes]
QGGTSMSEQEAKKIILKWLKESSEFLTPIRLFFDLENRNSKAPRQVVEAYLAIENRKVEYELLAEFASWGLEEVAE